MKESPITKTKSYLLKSYRRDQMTYGERNKQIDVELLEAISLLKKRKAEIGKIQTRINQLRRKRIENLDKYLELHDIREELKS